MLLNGIPSCAELLSFQIISCGGLIMMETLHSPVRIKVDTISISIFMLTVNFQTDFQSFGGWSSPAIKQYNGDISICSTEIDQDSY